MRIILTLFICTLFLHASKLDKSLDIGDKNTKKTILSQKKISSLDDKTRSLLREYRALNKELLSLKEYNADLSKIIASQNESIKSLDAQIKEIELTKREIIPLFERMLTGFSTLIKSDIPFLMSDRLRRLKRLGAVAHDASVSASEKFRTLFEAFLIEDEYGDTIEAYGGVLDGKNAQFLRIGRIALYAILQDEILAYNPNDKKWQTIDSSYSKNIEHAIKIAKKRLPADLLILPIFKASK